MDNKLEQIISHSAALYILPATKTHHRRLEDKTAPWLICAEAEGASIAAPSPRAEIIVLEDTILGITETLGAPIRLHSPVPAPTPTLQHSH